MRHRRALGATLVGQPAMTAVVAELALESEAATATAMRRARAHDEDAGSSDRAFLRFATAVSKYWICKRGPEHAYEALECRGGNGYTETFPLARRYREQPVMAVWEGSGNVIALDVLRAMSREPDSPQAFDDEVALAAGVSATFDAHLAVTRRLTNDALADPASAEVSARRLVASLALSLQASILLRCAPSAVSEALIEARLSDERGYLYGELAPGTRTGDIIDRAEPTSEGSGDLNGSASRPGRLTVAAIADSVHDLDTHTSRDCRADGDGPQIDGR